MWASRPPPPPRVRFFGWMLLHESIHCQVNLHNKHVLDDDICELCRQEGETCDHLIFRCIVVKALWNHLGWQSLPIPGVHPDHKEPPPPPPSSPRCFSYAVGTSGTTHMTLSFANYSLACDACKDSCRLCLYMGLSSTTGRLLHS